MSAPRDDRQRPAVRKDADGATTVSVTWESLVERLIREAQERGEFDQLPGHGAPIAVEAAPFAGDRALAFHILRNAGAVPPWIEADRSVREQAERHATLLADARRMTAAGPPSPLARRRLEARLEEVMAAHDHAVARLNSEAPSASLHRRPMDRDAAHQRLRDILDGPR